MSTCLPRGVRFGEAASPPGKESRDCCLSFHLPYATPDSFPSSFFFSFGAKPKRAISREQDATSTTGRGGIAGMKGRNGSEVAFFDFVSCSTQNETPHRSEEGKTASHSSPFAFDCSPFVPFSVFYSSYACVRADLRTTSSTAGGLALARERDLSFLFSDWSVLAALCTHLLG